MITGAGVRGVVTFVERRRVVEEAISEFGRTEVRGEHTRGERYAITGRGRPRASFRKTQALDRAP